jgi:hypothetical protein
VSDDARRPTTEEERDRLQAAKARGETCAGCGRALAQGEAVWIERFTVTGVYGGARPWLGPVGEECAAPQTVRDTSGAEPERCLTCGRGVFGRQSGRPRLTFCSRRCNGRYYNARSKKGTSS